MIRIIVSVVSHNHEQMIINFGTLKLLASMENVLVICRDNKPSPELNKHCQKNQIHYFCNDKEKGFAANNNLNFIYYCENFGLKSDDVFLLLNPDILLTKESFELFRQEISQCVDKILTANLFLDADFYNQDHNVRHYPRLVDFFRSYVFDKNNTLIDKSSNQLPADKKLWVSGAFLAVSSENYLKLRGLDEIFYMYCEDIDFCKRALLLDININMIMNSRIVHTRSRDSKRLFSSFFYWHFTGVIKLLTKKYKLFPKKSSLMNYSQLKEDPIHELAV